MNKFNSQITKSLFNNLTDRQEEVLVSRFGIGKSQKKETLEAIGQRFDVTRERIRQIESAALEIVRDAARESATVKKLFSKIKKELKSLGGVARKDILIEKLESSFSGITEEHLSLIAAASKVFGEHDGDDNFVPFYYLDKASLKKAKSFVSSWISFLKSNKDRILESRNAYYKEFKKFAKSKKVSPSHAESYVGISNRIHVNSFGDIGLLDWAEINPKTIRDRIYIVLRKNEDPVHFEDIAKLINKANFDNRVALASTVHNELIKDNRFVLVGRGIYGLSEHGYEPGTAKDVIARVLKQHGPLKSHQIVEAVQKNRLFKHNTILVNLQNRSMFERTKDGHYKIKEA